MTSAVGADSGSPTAAIEVHELAKRYEPAGVDALRGISFSVAEEEVFGFLGRNGAGKSTTVRVLTTLLRPTSGWCRVVGCDVASQPGAVRNVLGVALQESALDELMTGREHLVLGGRLGGLRKRTAESRAAELLDVFGLVGAGDRIAARYSGGMRRRLDVAMALVRHPQVLFLDEPTTGLDPQSRRALWALIRELRTNGTTVFLTTQYMAEADELCDRVAVVHGGLIAAVGTPDELKSRFGVTAVRLRVGGHGADEQVREATGLDTVRINDDGWIVLTVPGGEAAVPGVIGRLMTKGPSIERLVVEAPTLEDVFVRLTGTEIEASAGMGDDGALSAVRRGIGLSPGGQR